MNIWWIRRDLRLEDNQALSAALAMGEGVLPVFIFDPELLRKPAEKRHAFLFNGLRALERQLIEKGSGLILRSGNPVHELRKLIEETEARSVFAEEDVSPYARKRDRTVGAMVDLRLMEGVSAQPIGTVVRADSSPYTVFTPFSRTWKSKEMSFRTLHAPEKLPAIPKLFSEEIPTLKESIDFPAGEIEGQKQLNFFLQDSILKYATGRDLLAEDGTSRLSPYLRFGMVSARRAVQSALEIVHFGSNETARFGAETWLNELIWREFYQSILFHFPDVLSGPFIPNARKILWREAPAEFLAWKEGQTGYPVVDAGMRQLQRTGWMHNRARMITASFLVKHLLINWQEGEKWFMEMLIDGDPASNNGGWQWCSGTGTDAAPYFRIFNPILQGQKFDPSGKYVRRWVPELSAVPDKFIYTPWLMSADQESRAGCRIGIDYPFPIVDHALARQRALAVFKSAFAKQTPANK